MLFILLFSACENAPAPGGIPSSSYSEVNPTAAVGNKLAPSHTDSITTATQSDTLPVTTNQTNTDALKVLFLNVGKGDAALIGIPGGHWVMIDTGPKQGFPEIGRQLMLNHISKLSAIFITHENVDHIGGLKSVLSMVGCDMLYMRPNSTLGGKTGKKAKDNSLQQKIINTGDKISIGGASFQVVGPVGSYTDVNDQSLVIMLQYKGSKILFTADQLLTAEHDLLASGIDLHADVLKVAHHGAADTSSADFIQAVSPRYAIISTDSSAWPAQEVLNNINLAGGKSFILGETGTMFYTTDGKSQGIVKLPTPNGKADIRIVSKDSVGESVTIVNQSAKTEDLTGWCIFSDKGNDTYFFPYGTKIAAEKTITVYSGKAAETASDGLIWSNKNIWNDKKEDTCILLDQFGWQVDIK